jgi:hypothetical protein
MAGDFDPRPRVDVLTSVLNGVKPYRTELTEKQLSTEKGEAQKSKAQRDTGTEKRPKDKKESEQRRKEAEERRARKGKGVDWEDRKDGAHSLEPSASTSKNSGGDRRGSSFWNARPYVSTETTEATPDPSDAAPSSSRSSSKRPHTPFDSDDESLTPTSDYPNAVIREAAMRRKAEAKRRRLSTQSSFDTEPSVGVKLPPRPLGRPRQEKRTRAVKKGWKGWVEASEDEMPRDKLIELDHVEVLADRRTRSGKNFDAIGEGKDSWVPL